MQAKLQSVKEQITLIRSGPVKKRFPPSLKEEIVELYSASENPAQLLRELEVNSGSVANWRKAVKRNAKKEKSTSTFRPVSISKQTLESPRLVLANGICIENLSEDFLVKVLTHAIPSR